MGDLMDQGNQKSIFVQSGIHGNPMGSIGQSYIVPVPRNALVHNFKVDKIFLDELHAQAYRPLRNILFQDMLHNGKIRNFKMVSDYPEVFYINRVSARNEQSYKVECYNVESYQVMKKS